MDRVFERFAQQTPVTVMLRATLQHALPEQRIDELFRREAQRQYEDHLLFSTVVQTLSLAVCGVRKSVHAAYQAQQEAFCVSVTSLYNKLQGTEPAVARALVRESAERLRPVLEALPALPGAVPSGSPAGGDAKPVRRWKVVDGNHLAGTEHRLRETRTRHGQPLPGQALVVLDPQRRLVLDVFPCEDAYAQERRLLPDVLATVEPGDVWLGDRNFCTTGFLFGIARRQAQFLVRQHGSTLHGKRLVGTRRRVGRCPTGVVFEQPLEIDDPETGQTLTLRRITIELDQPTREGTRTIHLLTNLPTEEADALTLAERYRERWTIEHAFQELEQALQSEIHTLCYPKAALLALCVALYTYNVLSTLKSALHAAHGEAAAPERLSGYALAEEVSANYGGMMIALPPEEWTRRFGGLTPRGLARALLRLAAAVRLPQFRKHTRGPKQPPPKRTGGYPHKHLSTARLLQQRRNTPM